MEKLRELRKKITGEDREHLDIEQFLNIKEVLENESTNEKIIKVVGAFCCESKFGGRQAVLVDDQKNAYSTKQVNVVEFIDELSKDIELYNTYFNTFQFWKAKKYKSKRFNTNCIYWSEKE